MVVTVKIVHWDKHQGARRSDQKTYSWFKIKNSVYRDPKLFGQSLETKWLFFCLLCKASEENQNPLKLYPKHFSHEIEFAEKAFMKSLNDLRDLGIIEIEMNAPVTDTLHARYTHVTDAERVCNARIEENRIEKNREERNSFRVSSTVSEEKSDTRGAIADFEGDKEIENLLRHVTADTQRIWVKLYTDVGWIQSELLRAKLYYRDNPRKEPKSDRGWSQALTSWLGRGWSFRARSLPGNTADRTSRMLDELGKELGAV